MAGEKKLSAFVLPLPRNRGEDWTPRVVGVLTPKHPSSKGAHHLPVPGFSVMNSSAFADFPWIKKIAA